MSTTFVPKQSFSHKDEVSQMQQKCPQAICRSPVSKKMEHPVYSNIRNRLGVATAEKMVYIKANHDDGSGADEAYHDKKMIHTGDPLNGLKPQTHNADIKGLQAAMSSSHAQVTHKTRGSGVTRDVISKGQTKDESGTKGGWKRGVMDGSYCSVQNSEAVAKSAGCLQREQVGIWRSLNMPWDDYEYKNYMIGGWDHDNKTLSDKSNKGGAPMFTPFPCVCVSELTGTSDC
ncbi:hypothetical protein CEUSTIGMA_g13518.t1 [Chlamydomonas eustigma]|uniref:Uncharacterized protein n=1 Tax=Chlamydomonas eustigma TaxID=1157962 RepID=A0A250XSS2_9CHLO|nr:hypothetical protein CEUSTIGMA_g13518.t1 [Chlamydomonas eustigma]|eukprot:GAX86105.1 hypothetical protein CEUSTIGMA_g13518.t1 [Chlamydomonas eustigma]